jgi:hypothetical protein
MTSLQRFSSSVLLLGAVWIVVPSLAPASAAPKVVAIAERSDYKAVPLSSLKGSLMSGDPAQLPLLALNLKMGKGERSPQVKLDRSNPSRMVATVTRVGTANHSLKAVQYRVEMVKTDSMCGCKQWKVDWVGQQ